MTVLQPTMEEPLPPDPRQVEERLKTLPAGQWLKSTDVAGSVDPRGALVKIRTVEGRMISFLFTGTAEPALVDAVRRYLAAIKLRRLEPEERRIIERDRPTIESRDWDMTRSRVARDVFAIQFTNTLSFELIMMDDTVERFAVPTAVCIDLGEQLAAYRRALPPLGPR